MAISSTDCRERLRGDPGLVPGARRRRAVHREAPPLRAVGWGTCPPPPMPSRSRSPPPSGRREARRRRDRPRRQRPARDHRLLRARLRRQRPPGPRGRRRDRGPPARRRREAGAARGPARGPLGAAGLRRDRRARPARRRPPYYALERLWKDCPVSSCPPTRTGRCLADPPDPGTGPERHWRLLLRHGRTASNASGRLQGQTDVRSTTSAGIEATLRAGRCVTWRRPARSAPTWAAPPDRPPPGRRRRSRGGLDPRLREIAAGRWEGLTRTEIRDRWPEDLAAWESGDHVPSVAASGATRAPVRPRPARARRRTHGVLVVVGHRAIGGAARRWWGCASSAAPLDRVRNGLAVLVPPPEVAAASSWTLTPGPGPDGL